MPTISSPALAALVLGSAIATVIDLRTRRIPNLLTGGLAGVGVLLAASGLSGLSVAGAVGGLALGCALMLPGHLMGATGAGDVKLMGAIGAVVGPATVISAFLFTAVAGGVLAVAVATRRRQLGMAIAGTGRLLAAPAAAPSAIRAGSPAHRFAYGPAIAVGSVLAGLIG